MREGLGGLLTVRACSRFSRSSLLRSLGAAFRPLAATQGIPILEPVVIGKSGIEVNCCNDGHDENDRHICTSLQSRKKREHLISSYYYYTATE
jgi:hypothetical protein